MIIWLASYPKSGKTMKFFYLGPKNNWKEILSEDLKVKLDKIFEKDLKELSYK